MFLVTGKRTSLRCVKACLCGLEGEQVVLCERWTKWTEHGAEMCNALTAHSGKSCNGRRGRKRDERGKEDRQQASVSTATTTSPTATNFLCCWSREGWVGLPNRRCQSLRREQKQMDSCSFHSFISFDLLLMSFLVSIPFSSPPSLLSCYPVPSWWHKSDCWRLCRSLLPPTDFLHLWRLLPVSQNLLFLSVFPLDESFWRLSISARTDFFVL